ncbi:MAG: flagellin [Azonexus sp.]
MAATINTNTYSLNAQRNLAKNSLGLASAIERLSSGLRVNSARDDASGLARGTTLETTARTQAVQIRTLSDTISTAETQDGALGVLNDVLQRMSELQSDTVGIASGSSNAELGLLATQAASLVTAGGSTMTAITSGSNVGALATAIASVASDRATRGATMNNAEFSIQAGQVAYANTMAARGRIMDADFAVETSNLSRFQVLQQAGTAMVAQANAIPQNVLTLLR